MSSLIDHTSHAAAKHRDVIPVARHQMMTRILVIMTSWLMVQPSVLWADDWQQWLGPHRDGTWAADNISETFPANGPKLLWKQTVGGGYSGPAVASGCVIMMDRLATSTAAKCDLCGHLLADAHVLLL